MQPDLSDAPGEYPPFDRQPMARSGVVQAGDIVWFKFRFQNTGDTILDPEGMGGCQFFPELRRKNAKGKYQFLGNPYNLYIRDLEYLYPGESHEVWVHFQANDNGATPQGFGLAPGEYQIRLRLTFRNYRTFDTFGNIWDGPPMYIYEMPFVVEAAARPAPVEQGRVSLTNGGAEDKITRWIHTFEEFMTAFDCHISEPTEKKSIRGTLHLQVAPWTEDVVVKLIGTNPLSIASVAVPVKVDSNAESLKIKFDEDHPTNLIRNGMREPVIYSMAMADMRTNVQHGPFPERHIRDRLREMMDCGINVVSTTTMPWLYDDTRIMGKSSGGGTGFNHQGDAYKYVLDVARQEGMWVEGMGTYPFSAANTGRIAEWITGRPASFGFVGSADPSFADPKLPLANAITRLYQFHRWGDLYYQSEQGFVPIGVEDTRGWMRQDIHVRLPMGEQSVRAFQQWAATKYGSIDKANAAWGSRYKSFAEVDPEAGQTPNHFGHRWEYANPAHPFHDWNRAVDDLDVFRTEERVRNYRDALAVTRKEVPGAVISVRTEGGNVLAGGIDSQDPRSHLRHAYYSQRRCAVIAEILLASGLVKFHEDYITLPYTPTELRQLIGAAVKQGIVPMYLPQFDNMRDIAINDKYGTEYGMHYNLPSAKKGAMMHVLTAVYPWFKATYEAGGVPGILWEDYQCDGFATETQKREMRFFADKLRDALNIPDAHESRAVTGGLPSQQWRKGSRGLWSYKPNGDSSDRRSTSRR
jgi:hypothetical protein